MSRVASWGGDTDSVAAIAWGIASARYPDEVLPQFLEIDFEAGRGNYGAQFLKDLGEQLMCKYA
jgi:ADP-ribosylglycohydrolase